MADILVVDDEATIREPLADFLQNLGHEVTEAADGLDALTRLTERDFDLVLTDVMMPRMNGFQLLERALPHLAERTPMLILSSMDDEEGVQTAIFAGAFDYLLKPCDPERAERIIGDALAQRREWVRRQGPYRVKGPAVPKEVLTDDALPAEKVPTNVPLSGKVALKQRPGVVSVRAPGSDRAETASGAEAKGLIGRLLGLFGRKPDAA